MKQRAAAGQQKPANGQLCLNYLSHPRGQAQTTVQQTGDVWTLGVRDNGIGLKLEYAEQIFEPFKRLHGLTEYPGTGIGLAICRKSVERHGGRTWVESRPAEGAHFKFTLPNAGKELEQS